MSEVGELSKDDLAQQITLFPVLLTTSISEFPKDMLLLKTYANEFSIGQIVHHLADANPSSFLQIRTALTTGVIEASYPSTALLSLPDGNGEGLEASLGVIAHINRRVATFILNAPIKILRSKVKQLDGNEISVTDLFKGFVDYENARLSDIANIKTALRRKRL